MIFLFDISSLETNSLFQGGIAISIGTFILYQLKNIPITIWHFLRRKLMFTAYIEERDNLYDWVEYWLNTYKNNKYKNVYVKANLDDDSNSRISLKQKNDYFIIIYKNRLIKISQEETKLEKSNNIFDIHYRNYSFSGFFAKKQILLLLDDIAIYGNNVDKTSINRVFMFNGNVFDTVDNYLKMNFDHIFLDKEQKNLLINDLNNFQNNKKWYEDRGLSYKRGYLFYGPPGTGKSSIVKAIAEYTKRNVYYVQLNTINNDTSLYEILNVIKKNSIILFEDIDAIGLYRNTSNNENIEQPIQNKSSISLSGLLNVTDGLLAPNDVIVIMTTNYYERLDSALIRPGRIDMQLHINYPSKETIEEYFNFFYQQNDIKIEFDIKNISFATIKEICIRNNNNYNNAIDSIKTLTINQEVVYLN